MPPLSPAFRARRLLALTLRDLRRLATAAGPWRLDDWEGLVFGRLSVLPDEAEPLQRTQFVAAFSVGTAIIALRRLDPGDGLDAALEAVARGNSAVAIARLANPTTHSPSDRTPDPVRRPFYGRAQPSL
jgi:hypothetical protein